jgi:hypothetical protein
VRTGLEPGVDPHRAADGAAQGVDPALAQRPVRRPQSDSHRIERKQPNMTTATPTRRKADPLTELHRREQAIEKARKQDRRDGRDLANKVQRSRELHDERRRLIHREPGLVDHLGNPVDKKNPIAEIDREIASLGDLTEAQAKYEHAKALLVRAEQSLRDYVAAHIEAILDGTRPESQTITDELNAAIANAREKADAYLGHVQRCEQLTTLGNDGLNPRTIRGLEDIAACRRDLERWSFRTPIPEADDE